MCITIILLVLLPALLFAVLLALLALSILAVVGSRSWHELATLITTVFLNVKEVLISFYGWYTLKDRQGE